MSPAISPLAPASFPAMPPVPGVRLATAAAGIRYPGRTDVLLALFDRGTAVAGVFTRSKCPSAPVDWCRARMKRGAARALVVNSGNANAFTGKSGRAATELTAELAAGAAGCESNDVLLASTGVIGEPLDAMKFADVIDRLVEDAAPGGWDRAAQAIMTTDMFAKGAAAVLRLGASAVTICGIAKITSMSDQRLAAFRKGFNAVLANLAEQVARDGEGARKLVEIVVEGARSKRSARRIAMSIANSPLVKTAIAGEDANWGRVVMAVGKAGEPADRDRLSIWFNGIRVAHRGARDPDYDEVAVSATMKNPEIALKVALGLGKGRDRVLTCDLTKEYVAINGDYRS